MQRRRDEHLEADHGLAGWAERGDPGGRLGQGRGDERNSAAATSNMKLLKSAATSTPTTSAMRETEEPLGQAPSSSNSVRRVFRGERHQGQDLGGRRRLLAIRPAVTTAAPVRRRLRGGLQQRSLGSRPAPPAAAPRELRARRAAWTSARHRGRRDRRCLRTLDHSERLARPAASLLAAARAIGRRGGRRRRRPCSRAPRSPTLTLHAGP